jgi:hypothetical protein
MRKAKSPYQKYGKQPFRYSDAYRRLQKAIKDRANNVEELRLEHNKYLRDILGWSPVPDVLRTMKVVPRLFWIRDKDIDTSDIPEVNEDWFKKAKLKAA